jgi:hypothetical protein
MGVLTTTKLAAEKQGTVPTQLKDWTLWETKITTNILSPTSKLRNRQISSALYHFSPTTTGVVCDVELHYLLVSKQRLGPIPVASRSKA